MSDLENKIDFVMFVSASGANPNGDPLNANRPRTDCDGFGEISDVCIKRKIRNRMQSLGNAIFVQSDAFSDDGAKSLRERAGCLSKVKDPQEFARQACEKWLDVRSFGQVFAFDKKDFTCPSVGVRGPVCVHRAVSLHPVEVVSMQITRCASGDVRYGMRSSDTMGTKHFVRFGLYEIKGSVNVRLAKKTGFSAEDAQILKECLRTLFVDDASSARPDGSMEVVKLFWFEHGCMDGSVPSARIHRAVHAALAEGVSLPKSAADYVFSCDEIEGVSLEIIDGI